MAILSTSLLTSVGSLQDELQKLKESSVEVLPEEVQELVLDHIKKIGGSELIEAALKEGDEFPEFFLPDTEGKLISSTDLLSRGPLVVVFFRGGFCGFCNIMLKMIRKYLPHFEARGATVVGISPDSVETSKQTAKRGGLTFALLSDSNCELASQCNIAFKLDDPTSRPYDVEGLMKQQGNDSLVVPIPATYVVNTNGRVIYSFVEADFTVRAEPVDILNALPRLRRSSRRYLKGKLDIELANARDTLNENDMEKFFDQIDDLTTAGIAENAIQIGNIAPDFELPNGSANDDKKTKVSSKRLRKEGKYLVVLFYHGEWSRFCGITLEAMQRFLPKFEAKGAQVVAISPQTLAHSSETARQRNVTFPLLSDTGNYISNKFRLAFEPTQDMLLANQRSPSAINLRAYNGGEGKTADMLPLPAAYVIDPTGRVIYSYVQCDFTKRAEPADILAAIPTTKVTYQRKRGPFSLRLGTWLPAAKRFRN